MAPVESLQVVLRAHVMLLPSGSKQVAVDISCSYEEKRGEDWLLLVVFGAPER